MTSELPWYSAWFDENYLALYSHRDLADADHQINLIQSTVDLKEGARVLDLCCGSGRHTWHLNRLGYRVCGIDLSETLINLALKEHPDLDFRTGDMREIPETWDMIVSLFTSFGYFDSDEEDTKVIKGISRALVPGGLFWLDFLNPGFVESNISDETVSELEQGVSVHEKRSICDGRVIKDIEFTSPAGSRHYRESVRLYKREELEKMLSGKGLTPLKVFGDYNGGSHSEHSERCIILSQKTAS